MPRNSEVDKAPSLASRVKNLSRPPALRGKRLDPISYWVFLGLSRRLGGKPGTLRVEDLRDIRDHFKVSSDRTILKALRELAFFGLIKIEEPADIVIEMDEYSAVVHIRKLDRKV